MADRDFRIDLLMRAHFEQAQKSLDDADRKIGAIGKTLDRVNSKGAAVGTALRGVGVAATAAATAAAAVMGLYIARTIEAEKVQAQLQARLKDTGGVAGRTLQQLNDQAARLQAATTFDDEAIGSAQAMLMIFTQIRGVNFDRTIEAATDLATVMQTDLSDAAKVLGKALSDPEQGLGALAKAGVKFTGAQTEMIKKMMDAGQIAEAQSFILDKLQGTMGNAAEAARNTLGGALQALKNSFDNLLEGDSGDAGIVGARTAVEDLIRTLNDPSTKQGFNNLISGITSALSYLVRFATTTANVTRFIGEEIAARAHGPAIDDVARIDERIARLKETIAAVKKGGLSILDSSELIPSDFISKPETVIARLQGELNKEQNRLRIGMELSADSVKRAAKIAADAVAPLSNPAPEGEGVAKPAKTTGSKSDPDADIKRRIESLKEETALLGELKEGEDQVSEAEKARYAISEGEFKNKSPQMKAALLAAAEELDAEKARRKAIDETAEAAKKAQEAYDGLLQGLRTPAEVAVDDAIAKLKVLQDAIEQANKAGKPLDPSQVQQAQQRIAQGLVGDYFSGGPGIDTGSAYSDLGRFDEEAAREQQKYQEALQRLAAFRAQKATDQAAADAEEERVEAEHQARMRQIEEARQTAGLQMASSFFGQIAQLQHSQNAKAARIGKAAAIAQAIINTYQSATEAYKAMAGIPYVGPALGAAAAAAAVVAGMANVAAIRAQPVGYAEGGYTGAGGKYEPRGVVHAGEGVLNQEEIRALGGPSGFYALRDAIDDGRMRELLYGWAGYAEGGFVGDAPRSLPLSAPPAGGRGATVNNRMRVYLSMSEDQLVEQLLSHPKAEKKIIAIAAQNGRAISTEWTS